MQSWRPETNAKTSLFYVFDEGKDPKRRISQRKGSQGKIISFLRKGKGKNWEGKIRKRKGKGKNGPEAPEGKIFKGIFFLS